MVPGSPKRKSKGAKTGLVRLSIQSAVLHSNFRVLPLFHPKSPILIFQHPNMFPKIVYRYMNSKWHSKTHQTWNQMLFQHNSPIQLIFTKPSTTTQFIPQIRNYETQGMNHQQQYLITTTTSIKHDFIKNPSTTIHSSSFMGKTQIYMYIHHKHVKFNINNLIIFNPYTQTLHPNISTNFTN